ncbi:MAG: 4-hydroxybenzoate polyprenyltransferase [Limisphaerales bacterium]|jgi:4-hydroxybenzoate polyprenyltransferase
MDSKIEKSVLSTVARVADFLIYSNLFIALCAGGYLWATYLMIDEPVMWDSLMVLVTASTLALYLALRIHASRRLRGIEFSERILWVDRNSAISWTLFSISILLTAASLLYTSYTVWLALIPAGLLSIAYGMPFLPIPTQYKLRHKNFLKIFLIAGVWAYMSVILPVVHTGADPLESSTLLLFVSRFLFVLGITIPFDIRDIEVDSVYKLQTIPSALGVRQSIHLAWICLLVSFLLLLPIYLQPEGADMIKTVLLPMIPIYLFTAWLVGLSRNTQNDYLYLGFLDGTMLIQGPILAISAYFL